MIKNPINFTIFIRITIIAASEIIAPSGITIFLNKATISFLPLLPETNTHPTLEITRKKTEGKSIKLEK